MMIQSQNLFLIIFFSGLTGYGCNNVTSYYQIDSKSRERRQVSPATIPPSLYPFVVPAAQASVPCITCTYANRASCCTYYRRCCGVIAPGVPQTPTPGTCPPSASSLWNCEQTCLSDQECNPGMKCCPPPPSVCVIPFAANQCPLSISAEIYLRPCRGIPQSSGQIISNCQANEFCCPDPYAKGCCMTPNAISNPNALVAGG